MNRRLPLHQLKPDMLVTAPVCSASGGTLCAAGTRLSARMLQRLAALGVETAEVYTEDAGGEEDAERIRHRFRRTLDDPAMASLCDLFVSKALRGPCVEETPSQQADTPPTEDEVEAVTLPEVQVHRSAGRLSRASQWLRRATRLAGGTP